MLGNSALRDQKTRFRLFLMSVGLANTSDGMVSLTLLWLSTEVFESVIGGSLILFLRKMPWLLFSIPAGTFVDSWSLPRLLPRVDAIRAIILGLLFAFIWLGEDLGSFRASIVLLMSVLVFGSLEVVRDIAAQAYVPRLVPDARLEAANSTIWTIEFGAALLLAPAIAVILFDFALWAPLSACTLFLTCAAWINSAIPANGGKADVDLKRRQRPKLRSGLNHLLSSPLLLVLSGLTSIWNIMFFGMTVVAVFIAQTTLMLTSTRFSGVLVLSAIAAILGAILAPVFLRTFGASPSSFALFLSAAGALLVLSMVSTLWVFVLCLMIIYFCGPVWTVMSVSERLRATPQSLLGSVLGAHRFFAFRAAAFGAGSVGAISFLAAYAGHPNLQQFLICLALSFCGGCGVLVCGLSRELKDVN